MRDVQAKIGVRHSHSMMAADNDDAFNLTPAFVLETVGAIYRNAGGNVTRGVYFGNGRGGKGICILRFAKSSQTASAKRRKYSAFGSRKEREADRVRAGRASLPICLLFQCSLDVQVPGGLRSACE
jgi:hypothetical protein